MEEYLCMNLTVLILLVIGTVLVTICNVCLIIIKDWVLTRDVLDSINIIRSLRREAWTPEPCSVTC